MPKKIKQIIKELESYGFTNRGGKGSHRNYMHSSGAKVTVSGKLGSNAKPYQERAVNQAIEESRNERK